jgi:uncharacterized protein YgbK (DUF1537 family)
MSDLLLSWYGDDFSGSTDVLEALTLAGVRSVLFLEPPDRGTLDRFPGLEAAGVAGTSRTMTPEEMDRELPPLFERIRALGARLFHYKLCSTFDSSPRVGSAGRAIEIGRRVFGGRWVPLLVGAPALRRYTVFGNLFAAAGVATHRIDRHPTMSRHPVTPMDESDLRIHLSRQTSLPIALFDLLALAAGPERRLEELLRMDPAVVLFDVLDEERLRTAGRLIWESRVPFVAGSSGVEYALTSHWSSARRAPAPAGRADRLLVVSGSCSPVTDGQIAWALENGFEGVPLGTGSIPRTAEALRGGRSVVVYSARGQASEDAREAGGRIGEELGRVTAALVEETCVRRVAVAGGDTSGAVGRRLGIDALEMVTPIAPGSPLCRAYGRGPAEGLEIAMKGGQVGKPDYFGAVLRGAASTDGLGLS